MRPWKLTMQAFGSYGKKTTIDFTRPNQNLFLIAGNTGAGKTTIFDAMVFALYGEASSGNNRKDGAELQSQFEGYDVEPFVELVFSEREGDEEKLYKIRRVPRHVRPLKKGTGIKDVKETVSLILPDGAEYSQNQKESDKKLEEIVGLTKSQFMQVGMIAQGEFMELLRAKSDDKKIIFRKLFHTGFFQQVVEELAHRRKEKEAGIEQVQLSCRKDVGRTEIPEEYEGAGELLELRKRILASGRLNVADMEAFLEGLEKLCHMLSVRSESARAEHEKCSQLRDETRDAYTRAQQLMKSFEQLQKAEEELAGCRASECVIQEAERLMGRIRAAYEIQAVYQRYMDAASAVKDMEGKLREQRDGLPKLLETEKGAGEEEARARELQEKETELFARVDGRVKQALEVLKKLREAESEAVRGKRSCLQAEKAMKTAQASLADFEAKEQEHRQQEKALADTDALLERFRNMQKEASGITEDIEAAKKAQNAVRLQMGKVQVAQKEYEEVRQKADAKTKEHTRAQNDFLDAQAGFLAREKLRPGEPCPVCGSMEHPSPCVLSEEHRELTRAMIAALEEEAAGLKKEQEEKSALAGSAAALLEEKKSLFKDLGTNLRKRMGEYIPDLPQEMTLKQAAEKLAVWQGELEREGRELAKKSEELRAARNFLKNVEKKKQVLREALEKSLQQATEAKTALSAWEAKRESLAGQKDYPTEEAAHAALERARMEKAKADESYGNARDALLKARAEKEQADALIARYEKELPQQRNEAERKKAAYDAFLTEKSLAESEWQEITCQHRRSEAEDIQARIDRHRQRKASAEGVQKAARKAIGGQAKPVLEELEAAQVQAEEQWKKAQAALERWKEFDRTNREAWHALAPQMEERSRMTMEYSRLDGLYNRLAGKVSGARMDIETFVQRYYLERILQAANLRFRKMSAGQFELRMIGEEQAGEGKNRGLDLMVYSVVTGKEREVRTLSGGESFMAALSLALGMADRIQESSAAINLDVMFIDEGFGSLDDHSRSQAVKVLQQVSGTRLIGIISHVAELKQEIEDQLIVSKDEEGSHVKWVIS